MAASKMYTELCANCGSEVKFDGEVIRQDNPYWPWLDAKGLQDITEIVHVLNKNVVNLTDAIQRPGGGLIAQVMGLSTSVVDLTTAIHAPDGGLVGHIAALVKCFETLLSPPGIPKEAT